MMPHCTLMKKTIPAEGVDDTPLEYKPTSVVIPAPTSPIAVAKI